MNRFKSENRIKKLLNFKNLSIVVFLIIVVFFLISISSINKDSNNKSDLLLKEALEKDIVSCYALEGKYPESIDYIKNNYGLSYDEKIYSIDYTLYGDNIYPTFHIKKLTHN